MATSNTDTKRTIKEMPPSSHIVYISDNGEALKIPPVTGGNLSEGSYTQDGIPSDISPTKKGNPSENSQGNPDANFYLTAINTFRTNHPIMCTVLITACILGLGIGLTAATLGIAPAAVAMATAGTIAWHATTGAAVVAGPAIAHAATTTGSRITAHRVAVESGVGAGGGFILAGLCALGFLRRKKKADAELDKCFEQVVPLTTKSRIGKNSGNSG